MEAKQQFNIRAHLVIIEPPDLVIIRMSGELTPEDIRGIAELTQVHCSHWPHVLYISDNTGLTNMSPEARKAAMNMSAEGPKMSGFAIIGSGAMAMISAMLLKMIGLVQKMDNPTVMVRSEAGARAWIEKRRAELAKAA
jgi:hypothetical protein